MLSITHRTEQWISEFHSLRRASLPLCDDDVPARLDDGYPVGVEQLPVTLPDLPELELEPALLVKDLDPEQQNMVHLHFTGQLHAILLGIGVVSDV